MLKHDSPRILSLGVLNLDFVMELGNEMIGKKKMGRQISINAGGHGSSQAIAAVRCGVPTALIGKVGDDAFGQQIQCTLGKGACGLPLSHPCSKRPQRSSYYYH